MSSSPDARAWSPTLDLTPTGLSQFDPARVQEAINRGYQAGLRAGEAAAIEAHRATTTAEVDQLRSHASTLLNSLAAAADRLDQTASSLSDEFTATVVDTALRLTEAILQRELSDPVAGAQAALRRALAPLERTGGVAVRLHPTDVELLAGCDLPAGVHLEPDDRLSPGDALAVVGERTVDARIGAALARARAVLETGT